MIKRMVELFLEDNCGDWLQTKEDISSLFLEIKHPFQILIAFDNMAIENNICPSCGEEIITKEHEEPRGDFMGSPCYESMYERYCPSCGEEF